jgi:hypothetical protein
MSVDEKIILSHKKILEGHLPAFALPLPPPPTSYANESNKKFVC